MYQSFHSELDINLNQNQPDSTKNSLSRKTRMELPLAPSNLVPTPSDKMMI